ncbi:class I tRNA ligase family protein [Candidatus Poribacteria bacterium]|nr:class I tRNA ligase family protein [Candidatus Poribacteria bacterium]
MKKPNSPAKNTTRKRGRTSKPDEKPQLTERTHEKNVLKVWETLNVYPLAKKKTTSVERTAPDVSDPPDDSAQPETYVLREMPTSVHALTLDTLSRKICQDIFLKASLIQGHDVTYVPAWETYPLWIEESVVAESRSKSPLKLSVLRKRCRARHKQELEVQKQKFYQLGIFADWDASQKTLESRQEARLIALISRLRDSEYLHDLPQLSPWCPKCTAPINEANLLQVPTHALNGYVKFPFTSGLEEFGIDVSFCVQMPHLWEVAGIVELGITTAATYRLTKFGDEYLLFAEPQFEYFCKHLAKRQPKPKLVKKIKATELAGYTVAHPLFPSKELKITRIPETLIAGTDDESSPVLKSGVMPLNPAHHQHSYDIAQALEINAAPIFDETGRFTEEAAQLCGLYLFDTEKFIVPQLEKYGYLLKTHNDEIHAPHCPRCKELAVFRPCSKWVFSTSKNRNTTQLLHAQEYWDNYGDTEHRRIGDIRDVVLNFGELQVSTQRQWGMPLPILLCDQCDEPLTDKNTLNAIRNSIQRSFEFWFGLSIEELLPADTRCLNCNSADFRKEATLIDSHFANLLQTIDNSDFKKPLGGHTSVMFVQQASIDDSEWTKWLAEISIISAALSRSRPIKESQPFKQLTLKALPKINGEVQIEDAFLDKYPADVIRLVAMAPKVRAKQAVPKQLENLAESYLEQYQQLQALLDDIQEHLHPFLLDSENVSKTKRKDASPRYHTNPETTRVDKKRKASTKKNLSIDSLAVIVTAQLLEEVQQAYQQENFHEMWTRLTNFCQDDLRFYVRAMESEPTALNTLSQITTEILKQFAPLTPFLAEHFYRFVSIEGATNSHSIFQKNLHSHSPPVGQNLEPTDTKKDEAKAEWEARKSAYDAKS